MRAISCACAAPSSSSPRGARPRGRRRCPVFRSAAAIALLHFLQKKNRAAAAALHGVGRVGADLPAGTLAAASHVDRVGPVVQLSRNVAGPEAPFTGGVPTLSLFTGPGFPRSSVGRPGGEQEHTQRTGYDRRRSAWRRWRQGTHAYVSTCKQPRRPGMQAPVSSSANAST